MIIVNGPVNVSCARLKLALPYPKGKRMAGMDKLLHAAGKNGQLPMGIDLQRQSTSRCPQCGFQKTETMSGDSCRVMYECQKCLVILRPKSGDYSSLVSMKRFPVRLGRQSPWAGNTACENDQERFGYENGEILTGTGV